MIDHLVNDRKLFVTLTVSIHAAGVTQLLVCTLCCHLNTTSYIYLFLSLFNQIHLAHVYI